MITELPVLNASDISNRKYSEYALAINELFRIKSVLFHSLTLKLKYLN